MKERLIKTSRQIGAVIASVLVWFVTAGAIGVAVSFIWPSDSHRSWEIVNWRSLPGSILGILAGAKTFHLIVRKRA